MKCSQIHFSPKCYSVLPNKGSQPIKLFYLKSLLSKADIGQLLPINHQEKLSDSESENLSLKIWNKGKYKKLLIEKRQ